MNYLYICNYAANYAGNFIPAISNLIEHLNSSNVHLVFPSAAQGKHWIEQIHVPPSHIHYADFDLKSLSKTLRHLSKHLNPKQTLVHTHFVDDFLLLPVRNNFKKIVCHYHMTVPKTNSIKRRIKKFLNQYIYRRCIIVGVSPAVTADLNNYFSHHTCECISNAIAFQELAIQAQQHPVTNFLNASYFNVLIHGTHFFRKGVDIAIQAINAINQDCATKCNLYITSHDTTEAHALVNECTDNHEDIHIIDVMDGIKTLYDQIDCFISPSRDEAFGYAVAEAAWCECQVIASNVPGQNTMSDIPGIIWIEPKSVDSLENAIRKAISNKENNTISEINKLQKTYVLEKYDIATWVESTLLLYQKYFLDI